MNTHDIKRYTVSGDIAYPIHEDPEGDYVTYEDHVAAIEADRKRWGEPVGYASKQALDYNLKHEAPANIFPSRERLVEEFPCAIPIPLFVAPQPTEPVNIYVETRECHECGHVGINDAHGSKAACNSCDWTGYSPNEDHCHGCGQDGTMTAACPTCGGRYGLLAEKSITWNSAPAAQPDEPVKVPSEIDIFELWSGDPTHSQPIADKGKVLAFARALLERYGQQSQPADPDAERYRKLLGAGLPITYLGEDYRDKSSLDAAIDATGEP